MNDDLDALDTIGVAAALARNYAGDQRGFLSYLVAFLESAVPEHVDVERKPVRLFSKEKIPVSLSVVLGEWTYRIEDGGSHGPLRCTRSKSVRGVTLKTSDITMAEWLEGVVGLIAERSTANEKSFFALKNFLDSAS